MRPTKGLLILAVASMLYAQLTAPVAPGSSAQTELTR